MKSNWSIPKRYLRLTLYEGQKDSKALSQLTEDMSVKFNTSDSVSGALNEANIVISGLQVKKMLHPLPSGLRTGGRIGLLLRRVMKTVGGLFLTVLSLKVHLVLKMLIIQLSLRLWQCFLI